MITSSRCFKWTFHLKASPTEKHIDCRIADVAVFSYCSITNVAMLRYCSIAFRFLLHSVSKCIYEVMNRIAMLQYCLVILQQPRRHWLIRPETVICNTAVLRMLPYCKCCSVYIRLAFTYCRCLRIAMLRTARKFASEPRFLVHAHANSNICQ